MCQRCERGESGRLLQRSRSGRNCCRGSPAKLQFGALRRQQAAGYLATVADEVAGAGVAAMSMEEINAAVKAAEVLQLLAGA